MDADDLLEYGITEPFYIKRFMFELKMLVSEIDAKSDLNNIKNLSTNDQVLMWLADNGLQKYSPNFAQHDINGPFLFEMDDADLQFIGVDSKSDRKRIIVELNTLRADSRSSTTTTAQSASRKSNCSSSSVPVNTSSSGCSSGATQPVLKTENKRGSKDVNNQRPAKRNNTGTSSNTSASNNVHNGDHAAAAVVVAAAAQPPPQQPLQPQVRPNTMHVVDDTREPVVITRKLLVTDFDMYRPNGVGLALFKYNVLPTTVKPDGGHYTGTELSKLNHTSHHKPGVDFFVDDDTAFNWVIQNHRDKKNYVKVTDTSSNPFVVGGRPRRTVNSTRGTVAKEEP